MDINLVAGSKVFQGNSSQEPQHWKLSDHRAAVCIFLIMCQSGLSLSSGPTYMFSCSPPPGFSLSATGTMIVLDIFQCEMAKWFRHFLWKTDSELFAYNSLRIGLHVRQTRWFISCECLNKFIWECNTLEPTRPRVYGQANSSVWAQLCLLVLWEYDHKIKY